MDIGIDIGGTKCAVVCGTASKDRCVVQGRVEFATAGETPGTLLKKLSDAAMSMCASNISAVGVSCGGPLDSKRGMILSPPNLPGWDHVEIVKMLEQALCAPAYLCNDADACALAEWKYGAGKGCAHMVFLTFGTGMGAGLILNGRLYRGAGGMAGEIGHVRMERFGPAGYGKAGSFEGFCSGGGIANLARIQAEACFQMGHAPAFCKDRAGLFSITAKQVAECADAGDALSLGIFKMCGEQLGRGLAVLIDLLNPECIVIGSVFARCEHLLRTPMEAVMDAESLCSARKQCVIKAAQLGDSIGDCAALVVADLGRRGEL